MSDIMTLGIFYIFVKFVRRIVDQRYIVLCKRLHECFFRVAGQFSRLSQCELPSKPKMKALQWISKYNGKEVRTIGFDNIVAVFETPERVLQCAREIQKEFLNDRGNSDPETVEIIFTMGISVGQPLTETEGFFVEAIRMSRRLCFIAGENEIITSRLFEELCDVNETIKKHISLRTIKSPEQEFLDSLLDIVENHISDHEFGVDYLSHYMGVSRLQHYRKVTTITGCSPVTFIRDIRLNKALALIKEKNISDHAFNVEKLCRDIGISRTQLYRKVTAVTGRTPVTFIRDICLNRALSLIKENKYNLSEIALEIGYNSPSYFSKCFREKYGVKASKVAV